MYSIVLEAPVLMGSFAENRVCLALGGCVARILSLNEAPAAPIFNFWGISVVFFFGSRGASRAQESRPVKLNPLHYTFCLEV